MADSKLSALATLATSAIATGDLVPIVDVSDTSMAGSGTNKVFDASKIFLTDVAQSLTAATTMTPASTGTTALTVNMPTSTTGNVLTAQYNGTNCIVAYARADFSRILMAARDMGNDKAGPSVEIGRNSSEGAKGPAAGTVRLYCATSAARYLWVDDSAMLRIGADAPTGNANTPTVDGNSAGTVVGTQTSSLDAKNITGEVKKIDDVLVYIRQGAKAVQRFRYKSRAYNNHEFEGIVIDDAPRYGMDVDKEHPNGKSLNVATALGDLMRAVAYLTDRVETLEAEVATLQAG